MKGLRNLNAFCSFSAFLLLLIFAPLIIPSTSKSQDMKFFSNLELYPGRINDIAIVPSDPNRIFIGTHLGDGLYMSNDCGENWQAVETKGKKPGVDDFKNQTVFAISIAPSNPQVIWVAHGTYIEKSPDGGQSWTHISYSAMQLDCINCEMKGDDSRLCHAIAIDPSDPDTVYVGTSGPGETYVSGAVYKTADGGTSWTKMCDPNDFDFAVKDMDIDPQNSSIIWLVTNNFAIEKDLGGTLYRSNDGGQTWTSIFSGTPFGSMYFSVDIKPDDSNMVFTGSSFGMEGHFFDGNSWDSMVLSQKFPGRFINAEAITLDPQNPNTIYAAGDSLYLTGIVGRSMDGGNNWEIYSHEFDFISLAVHPSDPNTIFAGDKAGGLFRSNDHGRTWTPINNGISANIVYDVEIDPNDSTHILVGTISGVYEKKGEQEWTQLIEGTAWSVLFDPVDSLIMYAGMEGALAKSVNGGISWSKIEILTGPGEGSTINSVSDIAIDSTNPNIIFIAVNEFDNWGEIKKSMDGGASFTKVLDVKIVDPNDYYRFNIVCIEPSNSQHILAGGGNFLPPKVLGDLWESIDGGNTWEPKNLNSVTGQGGVIVNSILIHPKAPNILYVGTGYSSGTKVPLYKSMDGGSTWFPSFNGIPGGSDALLNAVTDLAFHPRDLNVVYASTRGRGIFISPNNAEKWLRLGISKYFVNAIAVSSLYGATEGGLLQLTGTGCLYGNIYDANSEAAIDGATILTDSCVKAVSIGGEYIMVSPLGKDFTITATANGYANSTQGIESLFGGDAIRLDFSMMTGDPSPTPCQENDVFLKGGNKYCFIGTVI